MDLCWRLGDRLGLLAIILVMAKMLLVDATFDNVFYLKSTVTCDETRTLSEILVQTNKFKYPSATLLEINLLFGMVSTTTERTLDGKRVTSRYENGPLKDFHRLNRRDFAVTALNLYFNQRYNDTYFEKKYHIIQPVSIIFDDVGYIDVINNGLLPKGEILEVARLLPCMEINPEDADDYFPASYVVPNDPLIPSTETDPFGHWHLSGPDVFNQLSLNYGANVFKAWGIHRGENEALRIAIIGTGCSPHPDLHLNFYEDPSKLVNKDSVSKTKSPFHESTDNPTGTPVAGMISATANNNFGGAGVCWGCKISCFKVYDDEGQLDRNAVVDILTKIIKTDIKIVYLGYKATTFSVTEAGALEDLETKGVLIVTPAGDDGCNLEGQGTSSCYSENEESSGQQGAYPIMYNLDNMIVVGASDISGAKSKFSNWGPKMVHIMAPGSSLLLPSNTAINSEGYEQVKGSSYSAALVTGVAALIWSSKPELSPIQVKEIIINSARKVGSLEGRCLASGIVDAEKALKVTNGNRASPTIEETKKPIEDVTPSFYTANNTNKIKLFIVFCVTLFLLLS